MRVALVTGAGSGIGLATALAFLRAGDAVVGVGRDPGRLLALHQAAGEHAGRMETVALDVTADDAPAQAVAAATGRFGRLDVLVNNAGQGSPRPVHETDDTLLDDMLGLMLRAPFRLIRAALPAMQPGSAIVNVSSTYALLGGLRGGAYSAAKAGLLGLTTHVACQYGRSGIRCNAVAPGVIVTDMTRHRLEDEGFRRMNDDMTPSPGRGEPDDVAAVIAFLCSPAARWVNGEVVAVDGGWSSTKFLTEAALTAHRTPVDPGFTHAGR